LKTDHPVVEKTGTANHDEAAGIVRPARVVASGDAQDERSLLVAGIGRIYFIGRQLSCRNRITRSREEFFICDLSDVLNLQGSRDWEASKAVLHVRYDRMRFIAADQRDFRSETEQLSHRILFKHQVFVFGYPPALEQIHQRGIFRDMLATEVKRRIEQDQSAAAIFHIILD